MTEVKELRAFFDTGKTKSYQYRLDQLNALERGLEAMEMELASALKFDLNKSTYEAYFSEINLILAEVGLFKSNLARWMKPKKVRPALAQLPGKAYIYYQPYGVVLIMSPWNYPLQLSLVPLIGAMAAGNTVLLKPSAYTPATSAVMKKLVETYLDPRAYRVIEGGREVNQTILDERYDLIFFTGSPVVGRIVMEKAAKHLTPVVLELGGKSPVILDETVDLPKAIQRILFGKLINSGQTCVAPDYLLIPDSLKAEVVAEFSRQYPLMIPSKEYARETMPHIVNQKHYDRLVGYLEDVTILYGGECDDDHRQLGLTIVEADETSPIMQEEIFGPILPLVTYGDRQEVLRYLKDKERPLALYVFSNDEAFQNEVIEGLEYGGGCINDTVMHLTSHNLPFGGVGQSGMGSYHGKQSFKTFSHRKSILKKGWLMDLSIRYHPFKEPDNKLPLALFRK